MDNNPKIKKSTKYLIIGIIVLFLSILGASVAYYLARVQGNLSGRAAGTELNVQVQKISSKAMGDLIPLDNDLETLGKAALGYENNGACVDINGYSVCQIYKITVTNNGSIDLKMNGTVTLSGQNTPNIDCAKMDDESTITNNNSCKSGMFVSGDTLAANNHNDYYVMVYINNLDEPQYDSGEFNGVVTFTTEDGRKVKGRFTKPFNLVQRIETLYNSNKDADPVVNNNIEYQYASQVGLMNDRLGGTTSSLDGGNIRYYGANPNNYIDIGNGKYTEDLYQWQEWKKSSLDECAQWYNQNDCSKVIHRAGDPILWRIIGVFDGKVRVIRDESIGNYSWDTSAPNINDGNGINEWSQADLMKLLNPGFEGNQDFDSDGTTKIPVNNSLYWNSGSGKCYNGSSYNNTGYNNTDCNFTNSGLSDEAKEYVVDQTINLGGIEINLSEESFAKLWYAYERGNKVFTEFDTYSSYDNDNITRTLTWTGKVGLPYPSDYGYATDFTKCTNTLYNYNSDECKTNDWLLSNYVYWTMSPDSSGASCVWNVYDDGIVDLFDANNGNRGVRPVLTLASEALAETGTGSKSDPYVLTS